MTTEEFRTRAANCLRWAQEAVNERTKELWLNMALIWLDRAENPHWIQISQEDHAGRQLTFRTPTMWRQDGDRRRATRALKSVSDASPQARRWGARTEPGSPSRPQTSVNETGFLWP